MMYLHLPVPVEPLFPDFPGSILLNLPLALQHLTHPTVPCPSVPSWVH